MTDISELEREFLGNAVEWKLKHNPPEKVNLGDVFEFAGEYAKYLSENKEKLNDKEKKDLEILEKMTNELAKKKKLPSVIVY